MKQKNDNHGKHLHLILCGGADCVRKGAKEVRAALEAAIDQAGIKERVTISTSGTLGLSEHSPIVIVNPGYIIYGGVKPEDAGEIVSAHLVGGNPVARLVVEEDHLFNRFYRTFGDVNFFGRQMRITLRNCGIIDPESIDDYLSVRGYEALGRVLTEMKPAEVIAEVKRSGLRGRGGAGFSTGLKWELTARESEPEKFVICNADEGDPGAFMDRSVIEGDPHTVLEGMILCGYAIGAQIGYIYIRAEYPLAIQRLEKAIVAARENNMLGEKILGSDFSFDIEIRLGAGAFVCGEETALIHSIEGSRGMPRPKPPFPAKQGLFGQPTVINNVETWANIPVIILDGADWFASIGTEKSKGTKVFALAGNVCNTGLVEVPMGTPLREIVYEIGGGIPNGRALKAVQIGGPSGGCLPAKFLDTPVDYESLAQAGAIVGSGGMIVVDDTTCMVNLAKFFLEFTQEESCGKCTPCREGTKRMLEILTRITEGNGVPEDIGKLERLARMIKRASLCGLGQTAPNPVLSTLANFREEYEEHVNKHFCRAGQCRSLVRFKILDTCVGCTACKRACPVGAISGTPKKQHFIDQSLCIKCGVCMDTCKFAAIEKR